MPEKRGGKFEGIGSVYTVHIPRRTLLIHVQTLFLLTVLLCHDAQRQRQTDGRTYNIVMATADRTACRMIG